MSPNRVDTRPAVSGLGGSDSATAPVVVAVDAELVATGELGIVVAAAVDSVGAEQAAPTTRSKAVKIVRMRMQR